MNKDYKNLQLAFEQFEWTPPEVIYRIYYDDHGTITGKTTKSHPGQHIVVSKETYDQVYMHTQWWVQQGQVQLRPVAQYQRSMLKSSDTGPYRTLPETPVFLVDNTYTGPTKQWTF